MNKLHDCYNKLQTILGYSIEPYESVELVERYRRFWKPDKVRIILLAESHVFTTASDRSIPVPEIAQLPGYPTDYAKFVYCMAYGEKQLTGSSKHPKRDGTPQFWKIFHSCLHPVTDNHDFSPILSDTPYEQRLKNKIELLLGMKQQGIWLVDASIVALYRDGKKPEHKLMSSAIRKSWDCYTSGIIQDAQPQHVICIGKGVSSIIGENVRVIVGNRFTVIAQPNAHLSGEEHMDNFKLYGEICRNSQ